VYEDRFPLETDGTKTDFQRIYLDHIFRFLGFTDIRLIRVQPTGLPGPHLEEALAKCKVAAEDAAKNF
jgi:FMN-dependent NADH-azoreductase